LAVEVCGLARREEWRTASILVFEAVVFVLASLIADVWLTQTPGSFSGWGMVLERLADHDTRAHVVLGLLAAFGLPSVLLVALTSLAIPALSPVASPRLFLLDPPHAARWPFVPLVTATGSPFMKALRLALWLDGTLVGLAMAHTLQAGKNEWPLLGVVTLMLVVELALLLQYVLWVLRVRQPGEAVQHVGELAGSLIDHVHQQPRAFPSHARLEQREDDCDYLKEIVGTLQQIALHSAHDGDMQAASRALRALGSLRSTAGCDTTYLQWLRPSDTAPSGPTEAESPEFQSSWLDSEVADALGAVMLRLLDEDPEGFDGVINAAFQELIAIADEVLSLPRQLGDSEAVDARVRRAGSAAMVFNIFTRALGRAVRNPEHRWRGMLVERSGWMLIARMAQGDLPDGPDPDDPERLDTTLPWRGLLRSSIREFVTRFGGPAIFVGDDAAVRSLLGIFEDLRWATTDRQIEAEVVRAAFELGALAVTLGQARCARRLLDWLVQSRDLGAGAITSIVSDQVGRQRPAPAALDRMRVRNPALAGEQGVLPSAVESDRSVQLDPQDRRVFLVVYLVSAADQRTLPDEALRTLLVALEALADQCERCVAARRLLSPSDDAQAIRDRIAALEAQARALPSQ
jgi:hypothetical protein